MAMEIKNLGDRRVLSPLVTKYLMNDSTFVSDDIRIMSKVSFNINSGPVVDTSLAFEKAGPRKNIFFDPGKIRVAILTSGGLCPGINDVIRSIVMESYYRYGAGNILGIRYGFRGLNTGIDYTPVELSPHAVKNIHKIGGTILGSSRGGTDDMESIVDNLERLYINILYVIGGDGSLRAAHDVAVIARERNLKLSVIGVPKTIDNDVSCLQKTFGFETAVSKAVDSITAAHIEAEGAHNGIGLVKLMGRHSGFIAANTALAMNDVNFVLIPEVPFDLEGENGFLHHLEERLKRSNHAVICVAEGAGQDLMEKENTTPGRDASGNVKLADIGLFLARKIKDHFQSISTDMTLKYIDPSYI
ncbi:MAG TPA: ATP-dependent 6-phosphofructokinase, partial [Spirochaetes bacterium]|nr:ATP-dependent 6-phosphofructokinase [Spirochaetota bacterium]